MREPKSMMSAGAWQFAYFDRTARVEMRISGQERFRVINALGSHTYVCREVSGYRRRRSTFSCTDAIADDSAAFERAALL
jgi:hypothetical protein